MLSIVFKDQTVWIHADRNIYTYTRRAVAFVISKRSKAHSSHRLMVSIIISTQTFSIQKKKREENSVVDLQLAKVCWRTNRHWAMAMKENKRTNKINESMNSDSLH